MAMTPHRLAQLLAFLKGLGLDPAAPGGPGATAQGLAPIEEALSHSSLGERLNHERLEFLGDAVLRLAATEFLRREHGGLGVGEQSALRSHLVSDRWLAELAETAGVKRVWRLGPMACSDGAGQETMAAECTEALLGGIYLAWGGLGPVMHWLTPHWRTTAQAVLADPHRQNWKSALQEWSQGQGLGLPLYHCEEVSLAHGDPERFRCHVCVGVENEAEGRGRSQRQAQQLAAKNLLSRIAKTQAISLKGGRMTIGPRPETRGQSNREARETDLRR